MEEKKLKSKKTLILETEKYHYQKVLSDIAGQDIASHEDDPATLSKKVRNWISDNSADKSIHSHSKVFYAFNQFSSDLTTRLSSTYTAEEIEEMPIGEYIKFAKDWIQEFKY